MKFHPKYAPQIFALLMALVMALIMTAFITAINTGTGDGYLGRWMRSFIPAWPLAMVCILLFANKIRLFATKLTSQSN